MRHDRCGRTLCQGCLPRLALNLLQHLTNPMTSPDVEKMQVQVGVPSRFIVSSCRVCNCAFSYRLTATCSRTDNIAGRGGGASLQLLDNGALATLAKLVATEVAALPARGKGGPLLERALKVLENATFQHRINQRWLQRNTDLLAVLASLLEHGANGTHAPVADTARPAGMGVPC